MDNKILLTKDALITDRPCQFINGKKIECVVIASHLELWKEVEKLCGYLDKMKGGMEKDIMCPFCNEEGFDLPGLKHHLFNHCEVFDKTMSIKIGKRTDREGEMSKMICPEKSTNPNDRCLRKCMHSRPHKKNDSCNNSSCVYYEKISCIPYKQKGE